MLRRAAVLALLLPPLGAAAQVAQGTVQFRLDSNVVTAIGGADCGTTAKNLSLEWTVNPGTGTIDYTALHYQVLVADQAACPSTATNKATVADGIQATAASQTYPGTSGATLTPGDVMSAATWATCTGADQNLYFCVRLLNAQDTLVGTQAAGTLKLQLTAPTKPTITSIQPGDGALTVTWTAGSGTVKSVGYEVLATAVDPAQDPAQHRTARQSTLQKRVDGLTNGVPYSVVVFAYSEGGNESPPSDAVTGTPVPVNDFWEQYAADGGQEKGGCASGAGGLLAFLGVAAALRRTRRQP